MSGKIKKTVAALFMCFSFSWIYAGSSTNTLLGEIIDVIFEALFEITALPTTFKPYPYCDEERNFITYDESYASTKIFISSQMVANTRLGVGNVTRLDGYFWRFFGPLVDNTVFMDTAGVVNGISGWWAGQCAVGGQVTVIKTNPFTMQFALQYAFDYGFSKMIGINDGNVFKFSTVFKSYPGGNLEIEDRFNFIFGSSFLTENELHLGFQINRVQLFGTWNYAYDYSLKAPAYNQWGLGAKLYI